MFERSMAKSHQHPHSGGSQRIPSSPARSTEEEDTKLSENEQYLLVRDSFLQLMLEQFQWANQYATKETLVVKSFKVICNGLGIDWASLVESNRNTFDLNEEVIGDIKICWDTKTNTQSLTADEQITYERVMSRDYVRQSDMAKLVLYMSRRCDIQKLHRLLAVDGFMGLELKRYIDHLKYQKNDFRAKYVELVKMIYDRLQSPEKVIEILHAIFQHPYDQDTFQKIDACDDDDDESVDDPTNRAFWMRELAWTFKPCELESLFKWKEQQWLEVQPQQQQTPQIQAPNTKMVNNRVVSTTEAIATELNKGIKNVKRKKPQSGHDGESFKRKPVVNDDTLTTTNIHKTANVESVVTRKEDYNSDDEDSFEE